MKSGLKKDQTSTQIIKTLKEKGLSYQRSNMLHDIRRKEATHNAKTPEDRARARRWFDKVYEPFREKQGYNSTQATRLWQRAKDQSFRTVKEAELGTEWFDIFKAEGITP